MKKIGVKAAWRSEINRHSSSVLRVAFMYCKDWRHAVLTASLMRYKTTLFQYDMAIALDLPNLVAKNYTYLCSEQF